MWLERFVIIVVSLTRDFLPSSWNNYTPTFWDWALYAGSFGLFFTLFFLFIRLLPAVATAEMKELVHHDAHHGSDSFETIRSRYYRAEEAR
jgi:Ni/Fe-hydrogenase subunit HybB-like protein